MKKEIVIHQGSIVLVDVSKLKPRKDNRNHHPQDQINQLAEIYKYQGFRNPIIVSNQSGEIVCGTGRYLAALRAGLKQVPVLHQDYESDAQEYAHHVSDNGISLWSEIDLSGINVDLPDLGPEFDISLLGIKNFTLDISDKDSDIDENSDYTRKVETPIYEPTGQKPSLNELFDPSKTNELIKEIKNSAFSEEIKEFLIFASYRHTKFNYKNIAEYYCHCSKNEQELFENSALVVVDFDRAIELGFVKMTEKMKDAYEENYDE